MIINVQKNLPQSDEFTFTAIDFERANNSQNSVCQVGICAVERGRIIKSCEYLVRPPQRVFYFQKKAMEIHGITYLDVEDALTFDKVWKKILPYIEGRPLVAHSFRDDAMTMDAILSSYRIKYHYQKYGHLCTLELAQRADIHGENNKYNLEALCGRYGISLEPHHAGSDAEGCAKLALALAEELSIDSFRSLADFSQTPDFHEPELPELLTHSDLDVLENYLHRLKNKKTVQLADCPRLKDLGRAKKLIKRYPSVTIAKDSAMSARGLAQWFAELPSLPAPEKSGRTRRRRRHRPVKQEPLTANFTK